ncbi:Helicase SKI2W [Hordeum vulgare]|nr:Helicase SKI2W [Hordeum vulgare]
MSADMLCGARNLFDRMSQAIDHERANHFIQSTIFEGAPAVAGGVVYDLVRLDLDGFPLNHVFPDDYGLEKEDEVDIDGDPQFEGKLTTQAAGVHPKRKSRRTKAYTAIEDKFLWGKEVEEEIREGEKPQPWGKTNSKKEDKRDATSITLITTMEDMITKKDSRKEKGRQDKKE